MRSHRITVALALCCMLSLQSYDTLGERTLEITSMSSEADVPPEISITQPHGMIFDSLVEVSGMVWDENLPSELHWELDRDGEIEMSGSALDSLLEDLAWAQGENRAWHWNISFDISSITPCSCTLVVHIVDQSQQFSEKSIIIFGRTAGQQAPPHLLIEGPVEGLQWRGDLNLTGVAIDDSGGEPIIEWAVLPSAQASHACVRGSLVDFVSVEDWETAPDATSDGGEFDILVDTTEMEDGWHLIVARAGDAGGNYSSSACTFVALHNKPPSAIITGPQEVNESVLAHFDASNSDDEVWGKEGLRFTFIVQSTQGSYPSEVHDMGETRGWGWYANTSGTFDVKVMVTDTSGLSNTNNTTVVVHNIDPIAAASVEGIPFNSDTVIRLPDTTHWVVDASVTTDTPNDRGGLDFLWYVDGEPKAIGEKQVIQREWLGDERITHQLTLSVTDDDGGTDWVEVFVGIEGTGSDPLYNEPSSLSDSLVQSVGGSLNMLLIFMLMLVGIAALTLRLTVDEKASEIPRWVPRLKRTDIDDAFDDEDDGVDEVD